MKFSIITLFPDLIKDSLKVGVIGQAVVDCLLQVEVFNPRDWTKDTHKTVDDRPFGGGDGMVLLAEPLSDCLHSVIEVNQSLSPSKMIYLSPQGRKLDHSLVMELSQEKHLVLLCGRYAGVDQRLINQYQFTEISIGDYVLSGGELAALVMVDTIGRQIQGVLGHEKSSAEDSFAQESLLEAPCFTRPREWGNQKVPDFLFTGNHAQIAEDRWFIGLFVTFVKRPDLFQNYMEKSRLKITKKAWLRSFSRLEQLSNEALTSLGFSLKNRSDFEFQLRAFKVI